MGQRSQIFVRYQETDGTRKLVARYYGWNYGERMISRARHTMEWLKENCKYTSLCVEKIPRILDTNFDMRDCVISSDILKEYQELYGPDDSLNDVLFYGQDNNDGRLLIDIDNTGNIKYAFLSTKNDKPLSPVEYMEWDIGSGWNKVSEYNSKETIQTCKRNISKIDMMADLMTEKEVQEFISADYSGSLPQKPKTNWIVAIADMLSGNGSDAVWCDDDGQILVASEEAANAVVGLIEAFYRSQGEEISVNTGYYDPEEDKRNGVENNHTGWWYICVN